MASRMRAHRGWYLTLGSACLTVVAAAAASSAQTPPWNPASTALEAKTATHP